MAKPFNTNWKDPRGHSVRIYLDLYKSAAWQSISPHDVLAALGLRSQLKGYNNGDLSLPLSKATECGIHHSKTLARSLRALCAVGIIAITRQGGCAKGGKRLPNLYRFTDCECFEIPAKHLEEMKATNEWKAIKTVQEGKDRIAIAEKEALKAHAKKICAGHAARVTGAPADPVGPITRARRDRGSHRLGHGVIVAENIENPVLARVPEVFSSSTENSQPRARHMPPLYKYQSYGDCVHADGHACSIQLTITQAAGEEEKNGGQLNRATAASTTMGHMLRRITHHRSLHHQTAVACLITSSKAC